MASRFGTTRLTASALTAHDQATTERNGSAPPPQAPRASSGDGWRSPRAANGGAPAEHAPRSGSASSAESAASDLVKPKYERQLLSEYGRIKQRNPSHAGPAAGDTAANRLSSGSTSSSASFKSFKDTPTNRDSSLFNSYRDSSVSSMPYNSNRDSLVSSSSYNTNRDSTLSSSSYASNRDSFTAPLKSNGDIKSSRPYSYNDNGVDSTSYKGNRDNSVSSSSYSNRDKAGYSAPYKSNRDSSVSSTSTYSNGVSSSSHGKSREPSSVSSSGTVREPLYSSSAFDSQTAATTREALLSSRSRDGSDPRGSTSSTASAATLPRAAAGKPPRDVKPGAGFEFDDGFVIKPPHMSARASRDYDDEVFSAEPATVTAPHVATHHGGASVASVSSSSSSSAAAGSRPGARAWSTYKPPASPSARAMARAAAPEPALAPAQRPFGAAAAANATPTRTQWNYREGGVLVQEVDEGQPCLTCHEKCPGFTPHMWR